MSKSALSKHKLYYEDIPPRKHNVKEGKPMTKQAKATSQAVPTVKQGPTAMEQFKTILIVTLIVGGLGFYGGMKFEQSKQAEIRNAVQAAQQAQAPATEVKK